MTLLQLLVVGLAVGGLALYALGIIASLRDSQPGQSAGDRIRVVGLGVALIGGAASMVVFAYDELSWPILIPAGFVGFLGVRRILLALGERGGR